MLNFVDVRITPQKSSGCIEITTSDRAYALTRSCLLSLKDEAGLPISLHSESVAEACKSIKKSQNSRETLTLTAGGDLPDRYENKFTVVAWQINIRGHVALNALSEDIATQLRSFGLNCWVFLIDTNV